MSVVTATATWFGSRLPTAEPVVHLLAAHQPGIPSRVTRCGKRGRTWQPLSTLPNEAKSWSRCPTCAASLRPPQPARRAAPRRPETTSDDEDILSAYATALAQADLAPGTKRIYLSRLRSFLAFLGTAELELDGRDPLSDAHGRNHAVREFRAHLKTVTALKPTTVNNYIAALDHFYGFYLQLGRAVVDRERLPRWAPKVLDPAQRKQFLRAVERCCSPRDKAVCLTLLYAGLRISELTALDLRDLIRSARRTKLIIRDGKGGIYREIPGLHRTARDALDAWLDQRPRWLPNGSTETALFLSRRRKRLSDRAAREIVTALGHDARLGPDHDGEPFGPHTLRHTLATSLREQGYDLPTIASILGHSSIEVTGRYTLASAAETAEALEHLTIET
jgi:site-specific recombinase XerD